MNETTLINDVTDTATWVAYYRAQESKRPDAIFKDPFAEKLVGDRGEKIAADMIDIGKYTAWSVVFRTVVIDRYIHWLVKDGLEAVVNLGAGLDARPYRLNLPRDFQWVEVDYPKMIRYKADQLKNDTPVCNLIRVEGDLANDSERWKVLSEAAPNAKKVLVLTEGVLPYLSPEQVAKLSQDILAHGRFKYWVAEYFHPVVYKYLKDKRRMKKMKNAPFRFFPPDYLGFFTSRGWKIHTVTYATEIAKEFGRQIPVPKFAEIIFKFAFKSARDEAGRKTGYMLLERS